MKVAICFSGKFRNNYKKSFESLKRNYLDKYDCDIYFHSWSDPQQEDVINLYRPTNFKIDDQIEFDERGLKCNIWSNTSIHNSLSQYYSLRQSFLVVKKSKNYDFVIRTRFDINHDNLIYDLNSLDKNVINLPKWSTCVDPRVCHRGYCDLFAVGNINNMEVYSKIFSNYIYYIFADMEYRNYLLGPDWPGQDSPLRNEYVVKWHLNKNKIPVNEMDLTTTTLKTIIR